MLWSVGFEKVKGFEVKKQEVR